MKPSCRLAAVALAAALAGCVPRQGAPVAARTLVPPADGEPPPLQARSPVGPQLPVKIGFDWGPPCRVPATERLVTRGFEATVTYDVVLTRGATSLEMRVEDMKFVRIQGHDVSDPAAQAALAPAVPVLPTVLVSDAGKAVGARGVEASLERAMRARGADDPKVASALALIGRPHVRALVGEKAGERWSVWAGAWTGAELVPGRPLQGAEEREIAPGAVVPVRSTVRHLGPVVGAPSLILLSWEQVVEGPEAARAMTVFLKQLEDAASRPMPPDAIPSVRRESVVNVALDPATARPHRARSETIVEVGAKRAIELHDTTFDWSRAEGCVAR